MTYNLVAKTPLPLYTETREHLHHMDALKTAYTKLSPMNQCCKLSIDYNKAFDFEQELEFKLNGCDEWIIEIPKQDVLKSITKSNCDIPMTLYGTSCRPGISFVVHQGDANGISIPAIGIPIIGIQYTNFSIRAQSKVKPGNVVLRSRMLPKHVRRLAAMLSHTFTFDSTDSTDSNEMNWHTVCGELRRGEKTSSSCCVS